MTHKPGHSGNQKVVGVFLDNNYAAQAAQALQSAGYTATQADESAINAFRNSGFQDEIVDLYRSRYNEGNTILVVEGTGSSADAMRVMLDNGAEYINISGKGNKSGGSTGDVDYSYGYDWQGQGRSAQQYAQMAAGERQYGRYDTQRGRASNAEELHVQLRREELVPTKQAVQAGEVEVRKVVHEREQQIPVTTRREEVYVETRPVQGNAQADEIRDTQDEVIRVPVYQEQVNVEKQSRVVEEAVVGKRAVEEQQNVTGTVRHEHLEVDDQTTRNRQTTSDVNDTNTDTRRGDRR
jgi:uncharacterized protein (TIGR02271 family)